MANIKIENHTRGRRDHTPYRFPLTSESTGEARRTGATTKLVNKAIDDLFTTGIARLEEYHPNRSTAKRALAELRTKFLNRLDLEHNFLFNSGNKFFLSEQNDFREDDSTTFMLCKSTPEQNLLV